MAAPLGNEFYKLATNPGRPKRFESPEQLWDLFEEYCQHTKDNPIIIKKTNFSQGKPLPYTVEKEVPLSIIGFQVFTGMSPVTWARYKKHDDFVSIIGGIRNVCYKDKFDGAAVEIYNPSIIARDLGLADKTQTEIKADVSLSELSDEELERRAEQADFDYEQSKEV